MNRRDRKMMSGSDSEEADIGADVQDCADWFFNLV
jgi:hypothetical protein